MRKLALATASALALVALGATPAHADQTFTGTISASDPSTHILEPDDASEGCVRSGGGSADVPVDVVNLTAQIAGNRHFVLTSPTATNGNGMVLYVARNGVCVAADYTPDSSAEAAGNYIDVNPIPFAAGDRITITVALFAPGAWTLKVEQPEPVKGAPSGPAIGRAARFAHLPAAISCSSHSAAVRFTRKAKSKAKKAVIKIDGKVVKKVRVFKPRRAVTLRGVPAQARTLSVVVTLKSGKKVSVARSYWRC